MIKKALSILSLVLIGLLWLSIAKPAFASPPQQGVVVNTPTPGTDGRILYVVKANDTCLSISLLMKVSIDDLRRLNNLNTECVIQTGQKLLLGLAPTPPTASTLGPGPTATPLLPTPPGSNGSAQVCVLLFEDVNGDAMRQETENALPDGAISLTDRIGKFSKTLTTTTGTAPVCFDGVPEGDYNVSVAVPQGYNPTTSMNYALKVQAGDQTTLDFGAQMNSQTAPAPASEGGRSPILGIMGGVLLLGGLGLGLYVRRAGR